MKEAFENFCKWLGIISFFIITVTLLFQQGMGVMLMLAGMVVVIGLIAYATQDISFLP